ncbi:short-chain dehydrogenase reductase sdr [Trichoderma arundinaceum]|uniref:Short-chain dehydrogenase reductase sdr n=1 Tax=Trichoderma arundinaceum TaxID=490622 RepID=A0A395P0Q5_TRIAR|nr:short-chain dehydrogenase reductase sdr [Trichoderma arundinaceum]
MATQKGIALILGAGSNTGRALSDTFSQAGYKVALVSRSAKESSSDKQISIAADLTKLETIPSIFDTVRQKLGADPNIVVYNAAALTFPSDKTNPFSIDVTAFELNLRLMNTAAYVAARESVAGFDKLPKALSKAFIYTGNWLNAVISPNVNYVTLASGKSAAAPWIGTASVHYKEKGYGFYFADERTPEGRPVGNDISGPAHAEFYLQLAEHKVDAPWHATFVAGKGLVDFPETRQTYIDL